MKSRFLGKDEKLIFWHVPKTAGTTVNEYIMGQIKSKKTNYGTKYFHSNNFKSLGKSKRNKYKFITGHLKAEDFEGMLQNSFSLTILREPLDRATSICHQQIRKYKNEAKLKKDEKYIESFHLKVRNGPITYMDCIENEDFARQNLINNQTFFCSDYKYDYRTTNEESYLDRKLLESAKKNIDKLTFVGLQENMYKTMLLLCYRCGWKPLREIPVRNATTSKEKDNLGGLSAEQKNKLMRYLKLDHELYVYAKEKFEKASNGIDYETVLKNYKKVLYSRSAKNDSKAKTYIKIFDFNESWYRAGRFGARWTGPGTESEIDFYVEPSHDLLCSFRVIRWLEDDLLKSLGIKVNDIDVDHRFSFRSGGKCSFGISKEILQKRPKMTTIKLCLNRTVSPKELNISEDDRKLGIQIFDFKIKRIRKA